MIEIRLKEVAAAEDACGKSTTGAPGTRVDPVTVIRAAIIAPARVEVIQFLAIGSRDGTDTARCGYHLGCSRSETGASDSLTRASFYCAFNLTTARRITSACSFVKPSKPAATRSISNLPQRPLMMPADECAPKPSRR